MAHTKKTGPPATPGVPISATPVRFSQMPGGTVHQLQGIRAAFYRSLARMATIADYLEQQGEAKLTSEQSRLLCDALRMEIARGHEVLSRPD